MGVLLEAFNRVSSFLHEQQRDADLEAELQSHIDLAVEENISKGMSPDEARRRALVRFGGVQQARERQRHARGLPALDILLQDLRYTVRTLNRNRVFTIVSILILALGIGANIAVFSVVNTLLLRPLPFYDPQRLVVIAPEQNAGGLSGATYSVDAYEDLLAQNRSYVDITGYYAFSAPDNSKLTAQGQPKPVTGIAVAANFFHVLGVEPALGRAFTSQEAVTGNPRAAMLSYPFWQRQFGGDRSIIGKPITLDGTPVTVVGVLPESFDFGSVFSPGAKVDFFTPQFMDDIRMQGNTLALIARLNPGVTIAQSRTEAKELFPKLYWSRKIAASNKNYTAYPVELKEYVSGKLRRSLIVLWCAVGLILLIVCVNLSNLLLARAAARSKEFALRGALGGTRGRLIRQLLTESLVLSTIGAVLGLGLAYALVSYLAHQGSIALPLLSSIRIDGYAIAWTLVITVGSAILFGLLPGIKMSSANIQEALKDSGPGMSDGRKHERLRSTLVISEVALACVLIVGAGLLLRSFLHVLDIDLGFQPATAAAITIDYDYVGQHDKAGLEKRNANFQEILHRINAIPGVQTSGITDNLPLERNRGWGGPRLKGKTYRPGEVKGAFVLHRLSRLHPGNGDAPARSRLHLAGRHERRQHRHPQPGHRQQPPARRRSHRPHRPHRQCRGPRHRRRRRRPREQRRRHARRPDVSSHHAQRVGT
jgi:predicted permease